MPDKTLRLVLDLAAGRDYFIHPVLVEDNSLLVKIASDSAGGVVDDMNKQGSHGNREDESNGQSSSGTGLAEQDD